MLGMRERGRLAVVLFVIFAAIMGWLGKDGSFRGPMKRSAPMRGTEVAIPPTLTFEDELRELGMCILDKPGGVCADDSVQRGEESSRARSK
jgi:hypothetical protein